MEIEERERACLEFLEGLPTDKYLLIGGYAVSSFEFPRFSVDLDLIVREEDFELFLSFLKEQGYKQIGKGSVRGNIYKGGFIRFEKRINNFNASIDLLVDGVHSRQTNTFYSFDYLFENSILREVRGSTIDFSVIARVADREMLIALKANSMRLPDQRDIIALCTKGVNVKKIARHLKRCPNDTIKENIQKLLETIKSPRHRDSIKGVFGLSDKVYEKIISRTERVFEELKEII